MPHIHTEIDFCADVYIVHGDKVLLRKHDKHHIWLPPGGHIELNEDPNEAAIREVREEVGLNVELYSEKPISQVEGYKILIPPQYLNRHRINETHEHIGMVYFARSQETEIRQLVEAEKVDDCAWFTKAEVEVLTDIYEQVRSYALKALEVLAV